MNTYPFPTLLPSELATVKVDFGPELADGETISTQSMSCSVYSGTDASPSSRISGSASAAGSVVSQKISAPSTAGNIYSILCVVGTSASQTLRKSGLLAIQPSV